MARRTTQTEFAQLVVTARTKIPDLSITTDVIVGFPGESEAEFDQSIAFVEKMAFARLHIFRYSRRDGTTAARLKGQVSPPVMQTRSRQMHVLNARLEEKFRHRFLGRTMPVLWESSEPFGAACQWSGLTGNYLRVVGQTGPEVDLHNSVTETELINSVPGAIQGRLPAPVQALS
jgi:threonylcarbamoyladenosine tRNA methylthiotransferase MtaB